LCRDGKNLDPALQMVVDPALQMLIVYVPQCISKKMKFELLFFSFSAST
jgi:hypothetical protein